MQPQPEPQLVAHADAQTQTVGHATEAAGNDTDAHVEANTLSGDEGGSDKQLGQEFVAGADDGQQGFEQFLLFVLTCAVFALPLLCFFLAAVLMLVT
jgi:hypothetical protein